jgi:hypothetical protein
VQSDKKQAVRKELEAARMEFHALAGSFSVGELRRQSLNPGWTNQEIMFHMTLGFLLLPTLIRIVGLWSRAPAQCSRAFADALNWSTPAFNAVNVIGPRIASHVFYGTRLERLYDRQHRAILRRLRRLGADEMQAGMPYPSRWDPLFADYMTVEKLLAYPIEHFRFHAGQLAR